MAKKRYINTKFWQDNYIVGLDPVEKLLYLYFLTNPLTDICGIYEIPLRQIAFDTGLDKEMVAKILDRFKSEKKIYYIDGWIYIANFQKHQAINDSVAEGIKRSLKEVPSYIMAKIKENLSSPDTDSPQSVADCDLPIPILKPKPILKPRLNIATETVAGINQVIDLFHNTINPTINYGNKTTRKATAELIKKFGLEKTVELTKYAISVQGKDYAPTITTPYQLKEKLAQLKIYADKSNKQLIQNI